MTTAPEGEKGIFANPVIVWKQYIFDILRSEFRSIYESKRGFTDVRFDNQFELVKLKIVR